MQKLARVWIFELKLAFVADFRISYRFYILMRSWVKNSKDNPIKMALSKKSEKSVSIFIFSNFKLKSLARGWKKWWGSWNWTKNYVDCNQNDVCRGFYWFLKLLWNFGKQIEFLGSFNIFVSENLKLKMDENCTFSALLLEYAYISEF